MSLAKTFLDLARLDLAQHQHRNAAVFVGFAASQRESSGGAWEPVYARKYEQVTTELEEKLGKASFSDAFGVARSMSIDQAFALARAVESENETQLSSDCSTAILAVPRLNSLCSGLAYTSSVESRAGWFRRLDSSECR